MNCANVGRSVWHDAGTLVVAIVAHRLIEDCVRWALRLSRSTEAIRAENLFRAKVDLAVGGPASQLI
jgi:hypothetical protein